MAPNSELTITLMNISLRILRVLQADLPGDARLYCASVIRKCNALKG
jgi:hypothetical protein